MIGDDRNPDRYPPTMGEPARLILQAQAAGEPITLSINGQGRLPVGDPQSTQQLHELVEQVEAVEALRESIRAVERVSGPTSLRRSSTGCRRSMAFRCDFTHLARVELIALVR